MSLKSDQLEILFTVGYMHVVEIESSMLRGKFSLTILAVISNMLLYICIYWHGEQFVMCLNHLYKATHCVPNSQKRRCTTTDAREDGFSDSSLSESHS